MCPNNKRDCPTLEKNIKDNIAEGSTVYTDGWAAYKALGSQGYTWDFVNHGEDFVKLVYWI